MYKPSNLPTSTRNTIDDHGKELHNFCFRCVYLRTIEMPSRNRSSAWMLNVIFVGIVVFLTCQDTARSDEVPAFFLKIAKNIPRVGRSGRFEDFYFKSAKNIPRIGRRDSGIQTTEPWSQYNNDEHFAQPTKRRMDYPPINVQDAWSWQHFPLAIEGPRELWKTLAGYSEDPSDDIDNEVWQRKKRTGNDPSVSEEN